MSHGMTMTMITETNESAPATTVGSSNHDEAAAETAIEEEDL
jgi:hypothetical protein